MIIIAIKITIYMECNNMLHALARLCMGTMYLRRGFLITGEFNIVVVVVMVVGVEVVKVEKV